VARLGLLTILTVASVVLTHTMSYFLSHPDEIDRAQALAGHGYLEAIGPTALVAGLLTVGLLAVVGGRSPRLSRRLNLSAPLLVATQGAAFLGLEIVERIDTLGQVAAEPAVAVGALLQAPLAWVLIRAISVGARLVRAVEAIRPLTWLSTVRPDSATSQHSTPIYTRSVIDSTFSRRGPPRVLF